MFPSPLLFAVPCTLPIFPPPIFSTRKWLCSLIGVYVLSVSGFNLLLNIIIIIHAWLLLWLMTMKMTMTMSMILLLLLSFLLFLGVYLRAVQIVAVAVV